MFCLRMFPSSNWENMFDECDADKSGTITIDEIYNYLIRIGKI